MSDQQIIELIKNGVHSKALNKLYKYFPGFKKSLITSGGTEQDAEDIFQQGLLILLEKALDNDFNLNCSINTFLFSICRNLSYEYFRAKGKSSDIKNEDIVIDTEIDVSEYQEKEKRFQTVDAVLNQIGKKCKELLTLFYYNGLSMLEIASKLGFKGVSSAKTQKYKCIEKARVMISGINNEI